MAAKKKAPAAKRAPVKDAVAKEAPAKKAPVKKAAPKKAVSKPKKEEVVEEEVVEETVEEATEEEPTEEAESTTEAAEPMEPKEEAPAEEEAIETEEEEAEEKETSTEATKPEEKEEPKKSTILPESEIEGVSETDDDIPLEKQNRKIYFIGIFVAIVVIAVTGGIFYMRTQQTSDTSDEVATEVVETPNQTADADASGQATEEEAEVVALERKEITLEVLNGSGVAGLAGDTQETFEALGYEVTEVGNADETEGNELYIRDDLTEEELATLLTDVEEELGVTKVTGELSEDDLTAAARIVLGS